MRPSTLALVSAAQAATHAVLALRVRRAALDAKAAFLAAGIDQKDEGTPSSDESGNTFDLPDGADLAEELRRWFKKQARHVLGKVPTLGAPLPKAFPDLTAEQWLDPMARAMTPMLSAYWDEAGKAIAPKFGLDPDDWRVTDPHLREAIEDAALDFCRATNATTSEFLGTALERLREGLAEGLVEKGEAIPELTRRVRAIFEGASKARAETIARTEASRAVHAAQLVSAAESGVVTGKKLLLSRDACSRCKAVKAEEPAGGWALDEAMATIGEHPTYAEVPHPPIHPKCVCSVEWVLDPAYSGEEA